MAAAGQGMDPLRVGFVGAGRMAEAIAQGFIRAGKVEAQHILASAPTDRNLSHFQALGCRTTHSNQEVLQNCFLVFFATKPHVLPAVLAEVAPVVTAEHILVSVAAGVSLSTLEELLPPTARVLRVSPNLPCMVQEGAMVMARGRHAGSSEATLLQTLLEACGQCEEVPEAHVDIHTGLSGSGVAFVCAFSEALAEGAIKMGMPGGLAHRIAAQTLLGRRHHGSGLPSWVTWVWRAGALTLLARYPACSAGGLRAGAELLLERLGRPFQQLCDCGQLRVGDLDTAQETGCSSMKPALVGHHIGLVPGLTCHGVGGVTHRELGPDLPSP
ncbi:pyrroline-5-carboxylate reductase 3 isoform X1 [Ursus americanus]|uniref:pyrroline-5-carboxylate reductase 3 isoform X1 n=1 Tax=Ursus americanus TaxID=9643 RepID=UPI001E67CC23|nr:pyrroline-5-carboxylate reductase 3 isoform X1 [Ursus americanus]